MSFLDKIRDQVSDHIEERRNTHETFKRQHYYENDVFGNVNYGFKDGDFAANSFINLENGKKNALIYGNKQSDYRFTSEDVVSFEPLGKGPVIYYVAKQRPSLRFMLTLRDGKKAQVDIIEFKLREFKSALGIE